MVETRSSPAVVTISAAAAERICEILQTSDNPNAMLKLGIKKGGCAGFAYRMELASEQNSGDVLVESQGARLLIESEALLFLLGMHIDYVREKLSSGFRFSNPNETAVCGCGESVSLRQAVSENFVEDEEGNAR